MTSVAEFIWPNWVSWLAWGRVSTRATVASGTNAPVTVLT